ncbi:MAG: NAD(P)-dependent oxidoreductase [Chloroflexota bacterium]
MTYLITGGMGCIGAWVLKHLLERNARVVNFDLSEDRHRLDWLMSRDEQAAITFVQGDLTDFEQVQAVLQQYSITHVIHLAAMQVPMCKADPVLGAQVNVTGTTNIFEAAHQTGISHVVYASSIAVYGTAEDYPPGVLAADAPMLPQTLYGVYKVANEGTARIYWQDHGISSTVLRPYTVYGVGRDQGLTSEPTKAMAAAAHGQDYAITFGGRMQFHFASDVARQFIHAADHPLAGARGFNLGKPAVAVQTVADLIMQLRPDVTITVADKPLPFPEATDSSELHAAFDTIYETPLADGVAQTLEHFARLHG